jgi:hypothetical protein
MNRRFISLDSLLAIVTVAFSVLCTGALLFDFWHAPDAYLALARA